MKSFKNRPKSVPNHSSRSLISEYRLTDPESLHKIQQRIRSTFKNQNCPWKQIKHLTSPFIDAKYSKRIDRLCHQFSIITKKEQRLTFAEEVDVESISHRFIKDKSKELKKQMEKTELKRSISSTLNRTKKRLPYAFFQLDHTNLNQMEKRNEKNNSKSLHKTHPYITIYEQSQTEALASLTEKNQLALGVGDEYPQIMQPDDWQKNHFSIKRIYTGLKQFRKTVALPQQKIFGNEEVSHFYLT